MERTSQRELHFKFPLCYKPFFEPKNHQILLTSGRNAGKTVNSTQDCMALILINPKHDIFVFRAKETSIRDADHAEVVKIINSNPVFARIFEVGVKPLRISRRDGLGTIYFKGADSVGADGIRNKGLTSNWPLLVVVISEAQEFRTRSAVENLLATVRRSFTDQNAANGMADDWRIFVTMNPPENPLHWINDWQCELENDRDWLVIKTSYKDIVMFLNDMDLKEIRKMKKLDYQRYNHLFMGIVGGGDGDVYPMLTSRHKIKREDMDDAYPVALVIGVDGAVVNDVTALSVGVVMSDGTMRFSQRDCFRHDPKATGEVIPSYSLCAPGGRIYKWFYGGIDNMGNSYKGVLFKYMNPSSDKSIPIMFLVDDAATELRLYLHQFFGKYASVAPVHKKTILEMVETCRNAIYEDKVRFIDDKGYYDYKGVSPVFKKSPFYAFEQMRSLKFDRTRTHYDNTIPNDDSDSATYAIFGWFRYPDNLNFGQKFAKMLE